MFARRQATRPRYTTTRHFLVFYDRLFFRTFLSYLLSIIYKQKTTMPSFYIFLYLTTRSLHSLENTEYTENYKFNVTHASACKYPENAYNLEGCATTKHLRTSFFCFSNVYPLPFTFYNFFVIPPIPVPA